MGTSTSTSGQARKFYDIFVSSTAVDLLPHRAAVRNAIEVLRQHPLMMEDFGARDGDPQTVATAEVAAGDVYLLVVAWRYGTVPEGETRSITHLEYAEAKALGKLRLVFLAAPETDEREDLFPSALRDPEHREALVAFRDEVMRERTVAMFTTPADLERAVIRALSQWLQEHPTAPRAPRNVPTSVADFVGRERELADLRARLRDGQSVGLSAAVSGMAGVGKSALAAEALRLLAAEDGAFPGGITWVRCDTRAGLPGLGWIYDQLLADWDAALPPEALARARDDEEAAALRERALRERLRPPTSERPPAPALVLLDNVEVELDLARVLATLMPLG
ncbi:MAG: DUF4062 domain-containing protein, partial [Ktedonobacterales bacterium]|nr:DUF4062 domain-containing protein [Ktedonobacterales bacterium]